MNNLGEIKNKLLKRKQELEIELDNLYKEKVSDDQVQDTGDQAWSANEEELKISLQQAELEEYNMVIKALSMIEKGTYGTCIDCGQPIAEKRLMMYPNATRCLVCQEAFERSKQTP